MNLQSFELGQLERLRRDALALMGKYLTLLVSDSTKRPEDKIQICYRILIHELDVRITEIKAMYNRGAG